MNEQTSEDSLDTGDGSIVNFEDAVSQLDAIDNTATEQQSESPVSPPDPEGQSEPGTDETDGSESTGPLTVKALAEMLKANPADLYKELQIDLGEDTQISLGQLKDYGKDLLRVEELQAEAQSNRAKVEAELVQKNQVLARRMARHGVELSDEDVAEYQAEAAQYKEIQDRTITELLPDYADAGFRQKFDTMVTQRLEANGVPAHEANLVTSAWLRMELYQHQRLLDEIGSIGGKKVKSKAKQRPGLSTKTSNRAQQVNQSLKDGKISADTAVTELAKML